MRTKRDRCERTPGACRHQGLGRGLKTGKHRLEPAAGLGVPVIQAPDPGESAGYARGERDFIGRQRPVDCRARVFQLGLELTNPGFDRTRRSDSPRAIGELSDPLRVASQQRRTIAVFCELFDCKGARQLEQSVTGAASLEVRDDQRFIREREQEADDVGGLGAPPGATASAASSVQPPTNADRSSKSRCSCAESKS